MITNLVHFSSRSNSINSHEEHFARFNHSEEKVYVMEYISKYVLLRDPKVNVFIIRMGAVMDDPVHVQIQIVKLRYLYVSLAIIMHIILPIWTSIITLL